MHEFAAGWDNAIPGVRLLIPRDSVRLAAILAAIAATASLPNFWVWPWLAVATSIPIGILVGARVPLAFTLKRLAVVAPFGLLTILFLPWTGGGPTFEWWGLPLSQKGLIQSGAILLKLTAACLWLCYLAATTTVPGIFAALRVLKVPAIFVEILETTVHYLAILAREVSQMLLALRSRTQNQNYSFKGLRQSGSRMGELVGALFIRTFERGERCTAARESRSFDSLDPDNPPDEDPPTSPYAIEIEGLGFRYPGAEHEALASVHLRLPRHSKIAILGINGAGKSTLLLHLNGVHLPDRGCIRVEGSEVTRKSLSQIRQQVGMVFQNPDDQVVGVTVYDDVCFGLRQMELSEEEIETRAIEALTAVGLRERKNRPPFSLSRGERKRAAIAGVLAVGADILVFDEPMASLDPSGKDEIAVLLQDLQLAGKTIIVATHDVDFASGWADLVVIMDSGRIMATGPPELLVDENLMSSTGLTLPLVSRPFQLLQPLVKNTRTANLEQLPANTQQAFNWLKEQIVRRVPSSEKSKSSNCRAPSND